MSVFTDWLRVIVSGALGCRAESEVLQYGGEKLDCV